MSCAVEVTAVTVGALSPNTRSAWSSHMLMSLNSCNVRPPKFPGLPSFNFTDCVALSICLYSCMWQQHYISLISDRIPTWNILILKEAGRCVSKHFRNIIWIYVEIIPSFLCINLWKCSTARTGTKKISGKSVCLISWYTCTYTHMKLSANFHVLLIFCWTSPLKTASRIVDLTCCMLGFSLEQLFSLTFNAMICDFHFSSFLSVWLWCLCFPLHRHAVWWIC